MGKYLRLYTGSVTAGETNGTEISEGIDGQTALVVTLNASKNEHKEVLCALRCVQGYKTLGAATVKAQGYIDGSYQDGVGGTSKFKFAKDNGYASPTEIPDPAWQDVITIDEVDDTNVLFWVRVASDETEEIKNDDTVAVYTSAVVMQKSDKTPATDTPSSANAPSSGDNSSQTAKDTPTV